LARPGWPCTGHTSMPSGFPTGRARSLDLDVLSEADARQLLAGHLGTQRLAAEPDAVAALLTCCAGLPLALCIVAARVSRHPEFPLRVLAEELHDQTTRLDALDAGELPLNLRAVFDSSYHALTTDAAILFGLLGLALGPDISQAAAASLIGLPMTEVRKLLRELESAHLMTQPAPGRYRMHDLLRLYAADQAHHHQPDDMRGTAIRRLIDFYLHTAFAAERAHRLRQPPTRPPRPSPAPLPTMPHTTSRTRRPPPGSRDPH
jgi:hypothetical protein